MKFFFKSQKNSELDFIFTDIFSSKIYPRKHFPNLEDELRKLYALYKKENVLEFNDVQQLRDFFKITNLLKKHPDKLIQIYNHLIRLIIKQHCFNKDLHEDVYQEIVLKLFEKQFAYIIKNYDNNVKFTPYFTKVILNLCLNIQTKLNKQNLNATTAQYVFDSVAVNNPIAASGDKMVIL